MGIVYSVEHTLTGEQLALKVMTAHHGATRDAIERFKREARASAKIKSEHVVRIIDADVAPELDRAPYLVMELLDGTDLERASGDQPMAAARGSRLAASNRAGPRQGAPARHHPPRSQARESVLDAPRRRLGSHQDSRLRHREDFRGVDGDHQSGQILGTPLYMSPGASARRSREDGPSSDLYALGLIAYKLLDGVPVLERDQRRRHHRPGAVRADDPASTRGCPLGARIRRLVLARVQPRSGPALFLGQRAGRERSPNARPPRRPAGRCPALEPRRQRQRPPQRSGAGLSTTGRRQQAEAAASASKPETATIAQSGGTLGLVVQGNARRSRASRWPGASRSVLRGDDGGGALLGSRRRAKETRQEPVSSSSPVAWPGRPQPRPGGSAVPRSAVRLLVATPAETAQPRPVRPPAPARRAPSAPASIARPKFDPTSAEQTCTRRGPRSAREDDS